jgi:PAS domain S-box-containing protein
MNNPSILKNYKQLQHIIGVTLVVHTTFILVFGVITEISFNSKLILLGLYISSIIFAACFYYTRFGLEEKYDFIPYIVLPLMAFTTALIAPPLSPYLMTIYYVLSSAYVIIFGTKKVARFLLWSGFIVTLHVFTLTTLSLPEKVALTLWMAGGMCTIAIRDYSIRQEIYNNRVETQEKEKLTEQLKLAGQKNEAVIENITDGIIMIDTNYNIVLFNNSAQKIANTSENEVKGKKIGTLFNISEQETPTFIRKFIQSTNNQNKTTEKELTAFITKTQQHKFVNIICTPLSSNNTQLGHLLVLHDMTKEKELEVMKLDFVSLAAHELRTPLTSINGYLSLLKEELEAKNSTDQQIYLDRAMLSTQQLIAIMETMLAAAKIERGTFTLQRQPIEMEQLIKEALERSSMSSTSKKLKISMDIKNPPLPKVNADQLRIMEVLNNLISNAINYTEAGEVTIHAYCDPSNKTVVTQISDTGIGIPQESIPKLFTKFYRVGGMLEKGSRGTGLGLFITKTIMDMHNSKIWVESEVGKGSTFSFSLPISE